MSSTTWKTAKKRTGWREEDRLKAEQVRRTAMETMGKTQKRKSAEGQSKAKKCRISETETVKFLKLKAAQGMDVKKQELELRKKEQEQIVEARNQQKDMFKQMKKQQQEQQKQMHDMQSLLMLQQQQQITALKNKEAPFCFNFLRSRFTFSVVIELSLPRLPSESNLLLV